MRRLDFYRHLSPSAVRGVVIWVALVALSFAIWLGPVDVREMAEIGYAALFAIALVSAATLFLPGPSFIALGLVVNSHNLFLVALAMGAGATFGELTGYLAGASGRGVVQDTKAHRLLERWMQRRGMLTIFLVAAIPNPFVDVVGIISGATRYPLPKFLGASLPGKVLRFLMVGALIKGGYSVAGVLF